MFQDQSSRNFQNIRGPENDGQPVAEQQRAVHDEPRPQVGLHAENIPMIAIVARRPFAISSQNFLILAAGSQKPTGACAQRTCR
eukprot:10379930-Heterocapsa_arctica.AAC.1